MKIIAEFEDKEFGEKVDCSTFFWGLEEDGTIRYKYIAWRDKGIVGLSQWYNLGEFSKYMSFADMQRVVDTFRKYMKLKVFW